MRNAALQSVVVNASGAHHVFEGTVAVSTKSHQLLHIALKSGIIALA